MTRVLNRQRILIVFRTQSFVLLLLIQTNCSMTWVGRMMVKQELKAKEQKMGKLVVVQYGIGGKPIPERSQRDPLLTSKTKINAGLTATYTIKPLHLP